MDITKPLLHLGKMTSKEIAAWMGITYDTFKHTATKRWEYLKFFADYEKCYGGVIINTIYVPYYIKNIKDDDINYLRFVLESDEQLTSVSGMLRCQLLHNEIKEEDWNSEMYRMRQAGERTFGKTIDENSEGLYGTRHYVWAVKLTSFNDYRLKTPEEDKIYERLLALYAGSEDTIKQLSDQELLKRAYKRGELTAKEFAYYATKDLDDEKTDNFYLKVLKPFREMTGKQLVCATKHEILATQQERVNTIVSDYLKTKKEKS